MLAARRWVLRCLGAGLPRLGGEQVKGQGGRPDHRPAGHRQVKVILCFSLLSGDESAKKGREMAMSDTPDIDLKTSYCNDETLKLVFRSIRK